MKMLVCVQRSCIWEGLQNHKSYRKGWITCKGGDGLIQGELQELMMSFTPDFNLKQTLMLMRQSSGANTPKPQGFIRLFSVSSRGREKERERE